MSLSSSSNPPASSQERGEKRKDEGAQYRKTGASVRVLIACVKAYRWLISPLFPPCCRYLPTCSEYAIEALQRHGFFKGSILSLRRVLRCHPFAGSGLDPVPPPPSSTLDTCRSALPAIERASGPPLARTGDEDDREYRCEYRIKE